LIYPYQFKYTYCGLISLIFGNLKVYS